MEYAIWLYEGENSLPGSVASPPATFSILNSRLIIPAPAGLSLTD